MTNAAVVVTVSDGVSQGVRDDASGRAVEALLESEGFDVGPREVVPDDASRIEELLRRLAGGGTRLVVTTGGTGLGPRDVTPEATKHVIEREAPGLAEEMRAAGRGQTSFAMLSRAVVGSVGSTLIVNLPGSEKGAVESLTAILPVLPHALELLAGHTAHTPGPKHEHAPGDTTLEEILARTRAAGEEAVLATAVRTEGNPPCQVGQKILLGRGGALAGTLGCAEFDDAAIADAPGVLQAGKPATFTYTHELGSVEVFLEPFTRRPRLVVFSATPVASNLIRWARELGFDPVLVESRPDRLATSNAKAEPTLDGIDITEDTSAVHTDHDAPFVVDTLAALLRSPVRFIGVMGSARHVGPHLEQLRDRGFTDQDLARIRTPVGVDIGAKSPEEIALSILAGLIADRHGADPRWLDDPDRRPR
jgi:molybdopterin adenylyltransferase